MAGNAKRERWAGDKAHAVAAIERLATGSMAFADGSSLGAKELRVLDGRMRQAVELVERSASARAAAQALEAYAERVRVEMKQRAAPLWERAGAHRLREICIEASERLGAIAKAKPAEPRMGLGAWEHAGEALAWVAGVAIPAAPALIAIAAASAGHGAFAFGCGGAAFAGWARKAVRRARARSQGRSAMGDGAAQAAAAVCRRFGFGLVSASRGEPAGGEAFATGLASVAEAIAEVCAEMGIEEAAFGMGAQLFIMESGESALFGYAGYVDPDGSPMTMALPSGVDKGTAAHEWTHLVDGKLMGLALDAAREAGALLDGDSDAFSAFSEMPKRLRALLPEADEGFERAYSALAGLPEGGLGELMSWREAELGALAGELARALAPRQAGGEALAGACGRWILARASNAAWPAREKALGRSGAAPQEREAWAAVRASAREAGGQAGAAGAKRVAEEFELSFSERLSALAQTVDGTGSSQCALPTVRKQGPFVAKARSAGAGRSDAAYWAEPSEMLARAVGEPDSLAKFFGGGAQGHAWACLAPSRRLRFSEGLSAMAKRAGAGQARLRSSPADMPALALAGAAEAISSGLAAFGELAKAKARALADPQRAGEARREPGKLRR